MVPFALPAPYVGGIKQCCNSFVCLTVPFTIGPSWLHYGPIYLPPTAIGR